MHRCSAHRSPGQRTCSPLFQGDATVKLARATVGCRRSGRELSQKAHVAVRRVTATAIAIGRPLLAGDDIYLDAPGVEPLQ